MNKKHDNDSGYKTTAGIKKARVKRAINKSTKLTGTALKKVVQWTLNIVLTLLLIFTVSGVIVGVTFYNYIEEYLIDPDYDIEYLETNLNQTTKIFYTD